MKYGKSKNSKTNKKNATLKDKLLEHLAKYPIIQIACERTGIGRATFYRWCKEDINFSELATKALNEGKTFISDLAESKLVRNIQDGNNTSIIFWLKNHKNEYSDKITHRYESLEPPEISKKDRERIRFALKNIGLASILKKEKELEGNYRKDGCEKENDKR